MKQYQDILMICTKHPELLRDKDARIPLFAAWRMGCLDGFVEWLKSHKLKKKTIKVIDELYKQLKDHKYQEPSEESMKQLRIAIGLEV